MPLRSSALFFRILRYFFHSFVAAKQKKEVLPLMILSNHFETAPSLIPQRVGVQIDWTCDDAAVPPAVVEGHADGHIAVFVCPYIVPVLGTA